MVVPMPIATPPTAATSGFWLDAKALRKSIATVVQLPPVAACMKSAMSLPAQKAPGAPAIITQRMASDAWASSSASAIAPYMASVRAFFFSGRFILMVRTPPSSVTRICSVIGVPFSWRNLSRAGEAAGAGRRRDWPLRAGLEPWPHKRESKHQHEEDRFQAQAPHDERNLADGEEGKRCGGDERGNAVAPHHRLVQGNDHGEQGADEQRDAMIGLEPRAQQQRRQQQYDPVGKRGPRGNGRWRKEWATSPTIPYQRRQPDRP